MEYETLMTIQGYAKFALILFVFIIFYSYAYSIYKRQKKGERDFEKYSNLVLDDSIESKPLEDREKKENTEKSEEKTESKHS
jgi:cytochrome c oxidase cbb3-type subunit 4